MNQKEGFKTEGGGYNQAGAENSPDVEIEQAPKIESIPRAEILRGTQESQASYLARVSKSIRQKMLKEKGLSFDSSRPDTGSWPEEVSEEIKIAMLEAAKPQEDVFDSFKNEEEIKRIEKSVQFHDKEANDSASFDKTERKRDFFLIRSGSSGRETYWNTLFFLYNSEATRDFAKKILDDKKIVLLGGGRSKLGEELRSNNIVPREIVNVDPFVENPEPGSDTVIPLSATAENFSEEMSARGIDGADEIWAEYSVPAYLKDPKEIQQLFENIDKILAEGGSARIWPLQVHKSGEDADRLERKKALVESLENLNATNKYDFSLNESPGRGGCLTLHKLKPSKKDLQRRSDQEALEAVRKEINQ